MTATAEAVEPTALAVRQMFAALPPPPPPGVAGWRGYEIQTKGKEDVVNLKLINPLHVRIPIDMLRFGLTMDPMLSLAMASPAIEGTRSFERRL